MATITDQEQTRRNPGTRSENAEPDASAKSVMQWMLMGLAVAVVVSIGYRAQEGFNLDSQPAIEPVPAVPIQ